MVLKGVVLLAAPTARSQAYLQALVARKLLPERVIFMGDEVQPCTGPCLENWKGVYLPDLAESLFTTCERAEIPLAKYPTNDVNSDEIVNAITEAKSNIVIYSGFGGQIVSDRILQLGPKFLHMHSGWLPEFRGSTTLYYTLLQGQAPAVTALLLDKTIDTGPIVSKKTYPVPPAGLDLDLVYDSAIRADLLVQVMEHHSTMGTLPAVETQDPHDGETYYVIHPVLKHLALLSLKKEPTP